MGVGLSIGGGVMSERNGDAWISVMRIRAPTNSSNLFES